MKTYSTISKTFGAIALAALLAASANAASSHRAGNTQGGESAVVDVLAQAQQNGTARIMVMLKEPASLRSISDATAAGEAAYAAANLALQASVLSSALGKTAAGLAAEDRGFQQIKFIPGFSMRANAAEIAALRADPRVEAVVENRINKPLLLDSTGIVKMTTSGGGYAKGATGKGQAVAVLDTGVNGTHEFMTGKVISEACYNTVDAVEGFASRCPGGTDGPGVGTGVDCDSGDFFGCGHGSHVAGIAAGKNTSVDAGEPLHGMAKNGKIVAINVFSSVNNDTYCGGSNPCLLAFDDDIVAGLERVYQLRNGVGDKRIRSANMSLGGGQYFSNCNTLNPLTTAAIVKLRDKGIATVIASGNDGFLTSISYPGCISKAIAVASSSKKTSGSPERISIFSNMSNQIDALAPGGDFGYPFNTSQDQILSQYDLGYGALAGTSMASPTVAGVIAALKSRKACRGKSVSAIETALRGSGLVINDVSVSGKRRVDIKALMKKLNCY
jgi:subtilisin family serine protease